MVNCKVAKDYSNLIAPIEDVIEDAYQGKMFILMDSESRENEGDLVIAAEKVTGDAIKTMVNHGTGIVCLAMLQNHMERLGLSFIPRSNVNENYTAFATPIDARYGITTGVSAKDRAQTILTAVHPNSTHEDLITPGHVFPVISKDGGVLQREGHTEASIDIVRLAGLTPAAVICELINQDGTMCRIKDVLEFAKNHKIKVTTIEKIIHYIKNNKHL